MTTNKVSGDVTAGSAPDRPVSGLAGITVTVPSPERTAGFLQEALDLHRSSVTGAEQLTCGPDGAPVPRAVLTLVPGDTVTVGEVTLQAADEAALEVLAARLATAGTPVTRTTRDGDAALAFHDPDGNPVLVQVASPLLERPLPASPVRPRRLGHVNLQVTDAPAAAGFWTRTVGLAFSEHVGELLYFFRAGRDHHNIGIRGHARQPGLHHVALEVDGWASYRDIGDRLAALGHTAEYGPGRHLPGNSLFLYVRDPHSGLRIELFCEMLQIDDSAERPRGWDATDRPRTVNQWGPGPPDSFLS